MMARVLDSQPEPPAFLGPPPMVGPIEPSLLGANPDLDASPFRSIPRILPQLRMVDTPPSNGQSGPVPEPSSWAMLIAGFAAVGWIQRRMARKARATTA
jgi:hypothetical protein